MVIVWEYGRAAKKKPSKSKLELEKGVGPEEQIYDEATTVNILYIYIYIYIYVCMYVCM